jgi:hypothetical protein
MGSLIMGFLTAPEFLGAIVVAGIGYVILLIRTAITQQQTLAGERMRDSIVSEVQGILRSYEDRLRGLGRELRELKELRRKDNLAMAKLLTSCPCAPDASDIYSFDRHPYEEDDEKID